jgi:hypothetical protein
VAEIVRPGVDGEFWPLDDAEAAATILIDRMTDPAALAEMAAHATVHVQESFSLQTQGGALLDFLDTATVSRPDTCRPTS